MSGTWLSHARSGGACAERERTTRRPEVYHNRGPSRQGPRDAGPAGGAGRAGWRGDSGRSLFPEAALGGEEIAQDGGAALREHAPDHPGPVVEARVVGNLVERLAGPRLRIG